MGRWDDAGPKLRGSYNGKRLKPSLFKKGDWVYTCPGTDESACGREGEGPWMQLHLKFAHGILSAQERDDMMKLNPRRKEYVQVRERLDA